MILERKEDFVKLYNDSVSLRDKIDTLLMEVDDVSRGVNHPEVLHYKSSLKKFVMKKNK